MGRFAPIPPTPEGPPCLSEEDRLPSGSKSMKKPVLMMFEQRSRGIPVISVPCWV